MKQGIATITLDYGKCPRWLFERIKKLGGILSELIIEEYGRKEFLKRLSNPAWFQAFGSLLAFDWNSSGLTVVLTAALKEVFNESQLGIYVAGGKGKTSRKTPFELLTIGEKTGLDGEKLVFISKLTAKVDNSLIQDGFNLYHHTFFVSEDGCWAVIQQGMNTEIVKARRYHWFEENYQQLLTNNLIEEPHQGIISDFRMKKVFNLIKSESKDNKLGILEIINNEKNLIDIFSKINNNYFKSLFLPDTEFSYHPVVEEKFNLKRLSEVINKLKVIETKTFIDLIIQEGVGPKTIRALSLASELMTGAKPSFEDPARYTFAHGGKDGTPYPVDKETYEETIKIFQKALQIYKQKKIPLI